MRGREIGGKQVRGRGGNGLRPHHAAFCTLYATALLFAVPLSGQPVPDTPPSRLDLCLVPDSIGDALRKIARRVGGEIGVTAVHIETGARISYNGGRRFPMASVSKVPMALAFLRRVESGEIDLSKDLVVPTTDFRAGYSPLASWSGGRAEQATVDSLFRLMIEVSDNTATDVILRMAGGPAEVTRRLRELGIEDVDVDRSEARTFADLSGIPDTVPESELYRYNYFRMRDALPAEHRQRARLRFGDDPRDTATPDGMAELLVLIHSGEGLSPESRDYLVDAMLASRSGPRRIKGLLPAGTPVAHKTGTIAGAINDVGIITLPEGAGHVAIAAFVYTFHRTEWRRERTIAEVSRLAYDYFSTATDPREYGPISTACEPLTPEQNPEDPDLTLAGEDAAM
ncbi:MAG: class A beta-lactamase [marine benthic group bacterium]|nr:class A beta-lactamase [Gemmatimonadota bacterium]MCL7982950.1 class A beta-lactamase [Gemmatimonadota bacterium]